jgi:hypothetical protein
MTRTRILGIIALPFIIAIAAPPARTATSDDKQIDAEIAKTRKDIQASRERFIKVNMDLSSDEAKSFDPIYAQFSADLAKLGDKRVANIKDFAAHYSDMTADKATELTQRTLELERDRTTLLASYFSKVTQALSAKHAARFVQLELYFEMVLDTKLAQQLPLVLK